MDKLIINGGVPLSGEVRGGFSDPLSDRTMSPLHGRLRGLLAHQPAAVNSLATLSAGRVAPSRSSTAGSRASLEFSNPYDNLYAFGKIWAGYEEPQIGGFHGLMYGRIGDARAAPLLLDVVRNMDNAIDTRHCAAEALGRIAAPGSLPAIRALASDDPEVSTRRALLAACEGGE